MPGYVFLAAGVYAFGGGLLGVKLLGVAAGGLATAAVYGTARALFDRGAAVAAGLLCALWPAGIAVSSVTGTDMPAAALLGMAVWLLARDGARRPWGAGAVRLRDGARLLRPRGRAAAGGAGGRTFARAARSGRTSSPARSPRRRSRFCVLLPWGLRNQLVYGELFLTDSHGGHTALVGANPNSEGVYSRSLNRLFAEGTGYALFSSPHRESDRAAYALAKQWTAFSPDYALGLLAAKADRLLGHERPLLYWPLYRQGVLDLRKLVRPSPGRRRASGRRQLVSVRRRHRPRDRRGRGPPQLAGARRCCRCRSRSPRSTRLLRRGALPPGDRRSPVAVRRRGAGLAGGRAARRRFAPHGAPPGGDRGAGGCRRRGADLRRLAEAHGRWRHSARAQPLGGLRLPGRRGQPTLRRPRHRADARPDPVAGARDLGRVRPAPGDGAGGGRFRRRPPCRAATASRCAPRGWGARFGPRSTCRPAVPIWRRPPGPRMGRRSHWWVLRPTQAESCASRWARRAEFQLAPTVTAHYGSLRSKLSLIDLDA